MRAVTRQEAQRWIALAKENGAVDDDGNIAVGRFRVTPEVSGRMTLTFVTPIVAGLYADNLTRKTPPIMFDRNEQGEIILPGRWWAHMFERTAQEMPDASAGERLAASHFARRVQFEDIVLPPDTDTIEFMLPDEDGNLVAHEALPPGGSISLTLVAS